MSTRTRAGSWLAPSWRVLGVLLGAAVAGACNSGSSTPTASTTTTTDSFNGSIAPNGGAYYPFTVVGTGTYTATLATLAPQSTITMGFGVGQPSGSTCSLINYVENARVGTVLSGAISAGAYCVAIYDIGNVQGTVTYTLTVDHP